jgi:hypothetical protein
MDARAILRELTDAEGLPREAIAAARARRADMVPLFLAEIEDYLAVDPAARARPTPLFFIFHLLGEWAETAAYRPLAHLLRCPAKNVDFVLGDAITSTSHRVMAAVFDGHPQPLYDIILDRNADEFVRSRMCEGVAMLALREALDRDKAGRFLRDAFLHLQPQSCCYVWQGWQSAIAMLGLSELASLVKKAFDRGYIDRNWLGFADFEGDLQFALDHPGESRWPDDREYTLFGDTVAELSTWYGFSDQYKKDRERQREAEFALERDAIPQPRVNPLRDVGRNDPCPCGSGKKFKKCRLQCLTGEIGTPR